MMISPPLAAQEDGTEEDLDALLEQADKAASIAEENAEQVIAADGAAHPEYVLELWQLLAIMAAILLLYLWLVIWTAINTKRRGVRGGRRFFWVLLVVLTSCLGWVIYLVLRPKLPASNE